MNLRTNTKNLLIYKQVTAGYLLRTAKGSYHVLYLPWLLVRQRLEIN